MNPLNSKWFSIGAILIIAWLSLLVIEINEQRDFIDNEFQAVSQKASKIRKDNKSLEEDLRNFENPEFLEKEAKIRLNYKLPGEEVYFIYKNDGIGNVLSPSNDFENLPFYKKWFYDFFRVKRE